MKLVLGIATLFNHLTLSFAQSCTSAMPYANMQNLNPTQLAKFGLTDPCSVICQTGYYGDFCEPNTKYSEIPQGPWNSRGYYTVGDGILKSMTLDVSTLTQISYTSSDTTLVGVYRQQLQRSTLVLISLNSRTTKTVLTAPTGGYIDAMQVRYGTIFVAIATASTGTYNIYSLTGDLQTGPYGIALFMFIAYSSRAHMIEIVQDKGMNTTFVYTHSDTIVACTPNQVCRQWYYGIGVTGMVCGIDCPTSLYISVGQSIKKLTDNGATIDSTTLVTHSSIVNCLASVPALNTLVYRVDVNVRQYSSTPTKDSTYNALLTLAARSNSVCSLDISESNAQILLVENGIYTLEALQQPCDYGSTSPAVASTSQSACVPCPPPPTNAYLVVGSATCQWQCYQGYTRLLSQCVSVVSPPCEARFTAVSGVCIPSRMPWVSPGYFVSDVTSSAVRTITQGLSAGSVYFPLRVASGGGLSFMASGSILYVSGTMGTSWQVLTPTLPSTAASQCGTNTNNQYTLLGYQSTTLFVSFTLRGITPSQHCLWALDASNLVTTRVLSTKPTLIQHWALGSQLCSVARSDGQAIYMLFCNTHYILKSSLSGERFSVLTGRTRAGYADGDVQTSLFNSPSSLVFYNQRLYVTDTGNCVIREIDVMRNTIGVIAGRVGVCQRQDGQESGLRGGSLLTPTVYDGYFLFLDQGLDESYPVLRQFHAPSGQVLTIGPTILLKVSTLTSFSDRIQVINGIDDNKLYDIQATLSKCPDGTMSKEGTAFSETECMPCGGEYYSSGGACTLCSFPTCSLAGERPIRCSGNTDSYCGQCTNKPSTPNQLSSYTGAATSYDSGSDCPWVYLPPCPAATYSSWVAGVFSADTMSNVCVDCPPWSDTSAGGKTSVGDCVCLGQGTLVADNTCVIPSPYTLMPSICSALTVCPIHTYGVFPFPISATCSYSIMDTPLGVCRCQPGEYISQIYPKQCSACPSHLYSPVGESCLLCPPYGEPSLDSSTCRCAGGTKDIDLAEDTIQCVCGEGNGFSVQRGCYECPANEYSATTLTLSSTPWAQSKTCLTCPAGTWSLPGAFECSSCPKGTYRDPTLQECTSCPVGQYATDPTTPSSCTACASECGGRKQTPCPTDPALYVCVDCPTSRANSIPNGEDDCATSCIDGFYELDGECTECTQFSDTSCSTGSVLIPCGNYSDAACAQCANASKPLYYSQWVSTGWGPSSSCDWECIEGYSAKSSAWVGDGIEIWMCVKESAWTLSDIFTV